MRFFWQRSSPADAATSGGVSLLRNGAAATTSAEQDTGAHEQLLPSTPTATAASPADGVRSSPRARAASGALGEAAQSQVDAVQPNSVVVDLNSSTSPRHRAASGACSAAGSPSARTARRTDSIPACLICLDSMDVSDAANVVSLGCQCKGAAAFRHRECLDRWLNVKGDTVCDVCGAPMASVSLPPPPPIPGYVVFPDLDHSFEVQWETFGRYLWHNAVAVFVYCLVLALLMDIKVYVAALIALFVICLVMARYAISVGVNTLARRTVLSFQAPEHS